MAERKLGRPATGKPGRPRSGKPGRTGRPRTRRRSNPSSRSEALLGLPVMYTSAIAPVFRKLALERVRHLAASLDMSLMAFCRQMGITCSFFYQPGEIVRTSMAESLAALLGKDILVPPAARQVVCPRCRTVAPDPEPAPMQFCTEFERRVYAAKQVQAARADDLVRARKQELKDMSRQADLELDRRRKEHKRLKETGP